VFLFVSERDWTFSAGMGRCYGTKIQSTHSVHTSHINYCKLPINYCKLQGQYPVSTIKQLVKTWTKSAKTRFYSGFAGLFGIAGYTTADSPPKGKAQLYPLVLHTAKVPITNDERLLKYMRMKNYHLIKHFVPTIQPLPNYTKGG
jgi:hypothetical protein